MTPVTIDASKCVPNTLGKPPSSTSERLISSYATHCDDVISTWRSTAGVAPRHRPLTPSFSTTAFITAPALLCGLSGACMRVLISS